MLKPPAMKTGVSDVDTRAEYTVLSICTGLGGLELGLDAALDGRTRTVCYVENEIGVASILASCMENGTLDKAPIWSDLRTFDPEPWRGRIHLICGGFPCQPHSVAGKRLGEDDPRELSGEVLRIAEGLGYPTLFLENVPGILRYYYDNIRPSLQEMGYTVKEGLFTAAETGAPHKRQRLFILGYTADSQLGDTEHDGCAAPPQFRGDEKAGAERGAKKQAEAGESQGTGEPPDATGIQRGPGRGQQLADTDNSGDQPCGCGADRFGQKESKRKGRKPQPELAGQGSQLADTECIERRDAHGDNRRDSAEGAREGKPDRLGGRSINVADTDSWGRTPLVNAGGCTETNRRGQAHAESGGGGEELADSDHGGGGEDLQPPELRATGTEQPPGDSGQTGSGEDGEIEGWGNGDINEPRLPLYPPGPGDHEGWQWLIERWPELAPTACKEGHDVQSEVSEVKSQIRSSPDGASAEFPNEVMLRAIGNGVIPLVAAYAWCYLSRDAQ